MTWFDNTHIEPQVVIEYETDKRGILDSELVNLASSSASLKVLITYIEAREIDSYLKEIINRWKHRSQGVCYDELLVVFCLYLLEKRVKHFEGYIGYVISTFEGRLQTKELEAIIIDTVSPC